MMSTAVDQTVKGAVAEDTLVDVTQEVDDVDQYLPELKARTGQAAREVEDRPEVTLLKMPIPPAQQHAADEPFPNCTAQLHDQRGEDA